MSERDPVVVVGAEDPEMRAIETRLKKLGIEYVQAIDAGGNAVHCGVAYNAMIDMAPELVRRSGLILVETEIPRHSDDTVAVMDHHRPGDPGFDLPIDRAVEASSLGQLAEYYDFQLTDRERILAAVDHSFTDVMLGNVPDIDPQDGLRVRLEEIAETHDIAYAPMLLPAVEQARLDIDRAPTITIGGETVSNMTGEDLGEPNSLEKLIIQTAAAVNRRAILIHFEDYEGGGDHKIMLNGAVAPETVQYFIDYWAPEHGFERPFGVPNRHYGGAYYPNGEAYVKAA